jgi:hypothetical protein
MIKYFRRQETPDNAPSKFFALDFKREFDRSKKFSVSTTIEINRSISKILGQGGLVGFTKKKTVSLRRTPPIKLHLQSTGRRGGGKSEADQPPPFIVQSCPATCQRAPTAHWQVAARFPATAAAF